MSNIIDKRATIRDKIIAKLFLASWTSSWAAMLMQTFVLVPLFNQLYYNYMSLVAINKVNKFHSARDNSKSQKIERGYTALPLRRFSDICISPASAIIFHLSSCLIPILNLVVLIVVLDDVDDISFSKRRKNKGDTYLFTGFSDMCIPLRAPQYSIFACCLIPS